MKIAPDIDSMSLFILLVFPGLISMRLYRLIIPQKEMDWKTALIEALFYGTINFGICLPMIIPLQRSQFSHNYPVLYGLLLAIIILIPPSIGPFIILFLYKCKWIKDKIQLPYPTAWDYYFKNRKPCFILVHLKNGHKIGGFYGNKSYATSFPQHGDLYLEKVIRVNENGNFIEIIEDSEGTIISNDAYVYIELFKLNKTNVQEKNNE